MIIEETKEEVLNDNDLSGIKTVSVPNQPTSGLVEKVTSDTKTIHDQSNKSSTIQAEDEDLVSSN